MKLKCDTKICGLDGAPLVVDQKQTIEKGEVKLIGGHVLTVGEALAILLSNKKTPHFNALKAFALAKRMYDAQSTELDEGDVSGLRSMMNEQDHWTPLVAAQILQALEGVKGR